MRKQKQTSIDAGNWNRECWSDSANPLILSERGINLASWLDVLSFELVKGGWSVSSPLHRCCWPKYFQHSGFVFFTVNCWPALQHFHLIPFLEAFDFFGEPFHSIICITFSCGMAHVDLSNDYIKFIKWLILMFDEENGKEVTKFLFV